MEMISFIVSSGLLAVVPILNLTGSVLKYRTGTSRGLIVVVLFVLSIVIWSTMGLMRYAGD